MSWAVSSGAGETQLHAACLHGDVQTAQHLLSAGVNVHVCADATQQSCLHLACTAGALHLVKVLLENGAFVSSKDMQGMTPLHLAAARGFGDITTLLLSAGAEPNALTQEGSTPLHYAALGGHSTVVQKLVAHGADVTLRNHQGQSASHWARIHSQNPNCALTAQTLDGLEQQRLLIQQQVLQEHQQRLQLLFQQQQAQFQQFVPPAPVATAAQMSANAAQFVPSAPAAAPAAPMSVNALQFVPPTPVATAARMSANASQFIPTAPAPPPAAAATPAAATLSVKAPEFAPPTPVAGPGWKSDERAQPDQPQQQQQQGQRQQRQGQQQQGKSPPLEDRKKGGGVGRQKEAAPKERDGRLTECSICLDEVEGAPYVFIPCGHGPFHKHCAGSLFPKTKHLDQKARATAEAERLCPLCMRQVTGMLQVFL